MKIEAKRSTLRRAMTCMATAILIPQATTRLAIAGAGIYDEMPATAILLISFGIGLFIFGSVALYFEGVADYRAEKRLRNDLQKRAGVRSGFLP